MPAAPINKPCARPCVGIIAGEGVLPVTLARHIEGQGMQPVVVAVSRKADPYLAIHYPYRFARMGQVGRIFSFFRQYGVSDLVLIGRIRRPSPLAVFPDLKGLAALIRLLPAFTGGDDRLLRGVGDILRKAGFTARGIHEYLPGLLARPGVWGKTKVPDDVYAGIRTGMEAAHNLGRRDIGQAVVVRNQTVIATEDDAGTDNLITRCRGRTGAILVKAAKPQQDRKFDLPTVGPSTVQLCKDAGFAGIAVEQEQVLVSDFSKMVELADDAGIFLVGVNGDEHP